MFGIEYSSEADEALKKAARKVGAYLSRYERVILADEATFILLAPHDREKDDLWLVCGDDKQVELSCSCQRISEEEYRYMRDLYHLYEFSPYFFLFEMNSPYLAGILRLQREHDARLEDVVSVLLRR